MEELLLRPLRAGAELHVVDEQRVHEAVARAPALDRALLQRGDQLVDELLRVHARDASSRRCRRPTISLPIACTRWVFPTPAGAVEEERVVLPSRLDDDRVGGVHRELVRRADLEVTRA